MTPETYLPSELAARWRCTTEHILDMIHAKRLPAFSLSKRNSKRPRYRITLAAVLEYEAGEKTVVPPKHVSRRRTPDVFPPECFKDGVYNLDALGGNERGAKPGQVIEFFKKGVWQPNAINEANPNAKKK